MSNYHGHHLIVHLWLELEIKITGFCLLISWTIFTNDMRVLLQVSHGVFAGRNLGGNEGHLKVCAG
jgi:hypothetical protein